MAIAPTALRIMVIGMVVGITEDTILVGASSVEIMVAVGSTNLNGGKVMRYIKSEIDYVELHSLYADMIAAFQGTKYQFRKSSSPDDSLALTCVPMFVGSNFDSSDESLMIVGRAVNGWDQEWADTPNAIATQILANEFDVDSLSALPETDGYYFSRSRFIVVAKEILLRYGATEENWASKLAWSNLYKVAPAVAGNPNGEVQHIQRAYAIQILKKEIEQIKPKHVLFMTGYDFPSWTWRNSKAEESFVQAFDIKQTAKTDTVVEGISTYGGAKIVVACRPETQAIKPFAEAVCAEFEKL